MLKPSLRSLLILLFTSQGALAANCTLTMGYPKTPNRPFIDQAPHDEGAFLMLFKTAAAKIGCDLSITRDDPKAIIEDLKSGKIDFYPKMKFAADKTADYFFMPNGFTTATYALSPVDLAPITEYKQVQQQKLTWLMKTGSSKQKIASQYGISIAPSSHADISEAATLVHKGERIFFTASKAHIDYFLKSKGLKSYSELSLQVSPKCCGPQTPMYLAFSKKSKYFQAKKNPHYNKKSPTTPNNLPIVLNTKSVAYRFSTALKTMQHNGQAEKIYREYFYSK